MDPVLGGIYLFVAFGLLLDCTPILKCALHGTPCSWSSPAARSSFRPKGTAPRNGRRLRLEFSSTGSNAQRRMKFLPNRAYLLNNPWGQGLVVIDGKD